ncbi:MAG: hypothetical protein ACK55Z_14655, partial [bacterium]
MTWPVSRSAARPRRSPSSTCSRRCATFRAPCRCSDMLTSLAEKVEKVVALKTAHDKVSKELAEYKEEFQSLKNQDVTIQRLKDKIASMEEERAEQVA